MSLKTASSIPFRGIGTEISFAHVPIAEGDLPEEFIGRGLLPKVLAVHRALSSPLWEWQSREKARLHCCAVGNARRRNCPKSVRIEPLGQHSQAFLLVVFSVKLSEIHSKSECVRAELCQDKHSSQKNRWMYFNSWETWRLVQPILPVTWWSLRTLF